MQHIIVKGELVLERKICLKTDSLLYALCPMLYALCLTSLLLPHYLHTSTSNFLIRYSLFYIL